MTKPSSEPGRCWIDCLNRVLTIFGCQLIAEWKLQWWTASKQFMVAGRTYPCFYHSYNCGWPPYTSERTVELALANEWLNRVDAEQVIEIGAVTPYYWPRRVRSVVDPFDSHSGVTIRKSLFDVNLTGHHVLSLSTFEHVGLEEYGASGSHEQAADACRKLFVEAGTFLITVPTGYNASLDSFIFDSGEIPADVRQAYLVRTCDGGWREEKCAEMARRPFGDPAIRRQFPDTAIGRWAMSVVILERGHILIPEQSSHSALNREANS